MCKSKLPLMLAFIAIPFIAFVLCIALVPVYPVQAAPLAALDDDIAIISVTHLALGARDIISDPVRHVLYASLPSVVGAGGNRIVPIAVPTGTLGTALFVGSEPNHMALSNDGQYLYVGIDGANAVRRVNLISYTAEIQIPLGPGGFCGPLVARDIVVLQDNPQAIAVSKDRIGCSPSHGGVTIFDEMIARPDSTPEHTGANVIEPSESPSILYGYNNETTEFGVRTLVIIPTGVTISQTLEGLINGFSADILFHDGLLYATNGNVIEPQSMTMLGSYAGYGPVAPDSSAGVVYMVGGGDYYEPYQLKMFDQTEFTLLKSFPLYNLNGGPKRLLVVDSQHLAMLTTTGDLYLITLGEPVYQSPAFDSTPILDAMDSIQYTYNITGSDPNYGDIPVLTAPVLPSWLYLNSYNGTGNVNGYPGVSDVGENPVELLLTDRQGLTTTQRFTITVAANPGYSAPTFTSSPELAVTEANTYTYDITVDDENEGDELYISAPVLPSWLEISYVSNYSSRLHGIPAHADIGEHLVKLRVVDNHGLTATQQFTIVVASVPVYVAPTFDSTPPLSAKEAVTYTYKVTASDADPGDVLTISAPELPSWLELSPLMNGAAILSGVAAREDIGEHAVSLQVMDSHNMSDTQSFTLTVVAVGQVDGVLFDDGNGNGLQDEDEEGIGGATVSLTPEAGSIAAMAMQQAVITTTTTNTGVYHFASVPTGNYTVSFDLPGDRPNPPSVTIQVTASAPTVIPPVAATPKMEQTSVFLPGVMVNANEVKNTTAASSTRK